MNFSLFYAVHKTTHFQSEVSHKIYDFWDRKTQKQEVSQKVKTMVRDGEDRNGLQPDHHHHHLGKVFEAS